MLEVVRVPAVYVPLLVFVKAEGVFQLPIVFATVDTV
jgi:hypothetical protein